MDSSAEQLVAPALGALAVAEGLLHGEEHPRVDNALAMRFGVTAAVAIDINASEVYPHLCGPLLQGVQPLGQQDPARGMDGCHGQGSKQALVPECS